MSGKTFFDITGKYAELKNSKYVIISAPFDGTSTWRKGADKGPAAIFKASHYVELYDIETGVEGYKSGIYTDTEKRNFSTSKSMISSLKKAAAKYIKMGKIPVVIGGEHSISIGSASAISSFFSDFTFLQLDAHSDMRDVYEGSSYNHACTMARLKEFGDIVQVGVRSMDQSEIKKIQADRIFFAHQIYNGTNWIDSVVKKLNRNVYITIDLDVFDPSIMPSTGTPEPGGLGWYQVCELVKTVCKKRNLIGFDITELCPDANKSSDFLAAKLIYTIISYNESFFNRREKNLK
ncbi:agmatinase [Candidatus Dependentiae bacterium]|nr:agmatinase [Candidatus Dependentiae bacterium]